jgi:hypothetical protein
VHVLGFQATRAVQRRLVGVAITAALLAVGIVSGCARDANGDHKATILRITEQDFRIKAPHVVRAGEIELRSRNRGPDDHELIVVRHGEGRLPMRSDGITIDEDALQRQKVGALEPFAPGTVDVLHVELTPGRYILFCNMAGHFLGGMHSTLVVR